MDQMIWTREHLDGEYGCRVSTMGGEFEIRVDALQTEHAADLDEAKTRADDLVQADLRHECKRPRCTGWKQIA
jgi:hypothetical protein